MIEDTDVSMHVAVVRQGKAQTMITKGLEILGRESKQSEAAEYEHTSNAYLATLAQASHLIAGHIFFP